MMIAIGNAANNMNFFVSAPKAAAPAIFRSTRQIASGQYAYDFASPPDPTYIIDVLKLSINQLINYIT